MLCLTDAVLVFLHSLQENFKFLFYRLHLDDLGPKIVSKMEIESSMRDQGLKNLAVKLRVPKRLSDDNHKWVHKLLGNDITKCIQSNVFGPASLEDIMTDIETADIEQRVRRNLFKAIKTGSSKSGNKLAYTPDGQLSVKFLEYDVYTVDELKVLAFAALTWNIKLPSIPYKVLNIFPWQRNCCMTVEEQEIVETWCWQKMYDRVAAKCGIE